MTADREQTRRDAEWLLHHWTEPAFARTRLQEVAVSLARSVPPLLVELEQAERELRLAIDRAVTAEARLASVPALVDALASDAHSEMATVAGLLRLGGFDATRLAERLAAACERARAALTVYEQSQGNG